MQIKLYGEKNLFIKEVNISKFLDEGLLAELGPENTHTLIGLGLFLPVCYPSQSHLSKVLGLSRTTVNQRVQKLLNFYHKGKAIISVEKYRDKGKFDNNVYQIFKNSGITIFNDDDYGV